MKFITSFDADVHGLAQNSAGFAPILMSFSRSVVIVPAQDATEPLRQHTKESLERFPPPET